MPHRKYIDVRVHRRVPSFFRPNATTTCLPRSSCMTKAHVFTKKSIIITLHTARGASYRSARREILHLEGQISDSKPPWSHLFGLLGFPFIRNRLVHVNSLPEEKKRQNLGFSEKEWYYRRRLTKAIRRGTQKGVRDACSNIYGPTK